MSVAGVAIGLPADELSTLQRVRQLQVMIEQARQQEGGDAGSVAVAPTAGPPHGGGGSDFAAALSSAQSGYASFAASPSTGAAAPEGSSDTSAYESLVKQAAARYGLDPAILHGLIEQESGFDPNSTSSAGAAGLTQLMPGTAASLGVANPLDPAESIEGGARYLSQMVARFGGNVSDALAAYNAGPGAVQRYGGVPPYAETEAYVSKVLGYAEAYRQAHGATLAGGVA